MEHENKKVLIINFTSLIEENATGITMRSIFNNLEFGNWFEISCSPTSKDTYYKNKKIYSLPHKYYPIHYIFNKNIFKDINKSSKENLNQSIINEKKKANGNIRKAFIAYADVLPLIPPKELIKKVEKFKPDCIYTMGASVLTMKLALYFSKKLNIKIVMHFMDNWQDTLYKDNIFTKPCNFIMENTLKKVYKHMDIGLTISEKMAKEYSRRWEKPHLPLMNVISKIEDYPLIRLPDKKIIFTYAGGLHLERWKSLIEIVEVIKEKNILSNKKIVLHIYTSLKDRALYEQLFDKSVVKFYDYVSHELIDEVYKKTDLLLHIESFNNEIITFTKYSLSTKISEYMSSGKPILLYAPKNIAVSEYIKNHDAGITCSSKQELRISIRKLMNSEDLKIKLAMNGIKCAKNNHSANIASEVLNKAFNGIS